MGTNNAGLIRARTKAIKSGDTLEASRLGSLIEASQNECPHDETDENVKLVREVHEDPLPTMWSTLTEDSVNKKYHKGGRLKWCSLCSKVLDYEPRE